MKKLFVVCILCILLSSCSPVEPAPALPTQPSITPSQTPTPTETRIRKDGMEEVYIPAGEFLMGSSADEETSAAYPQHSVTLDAYWMDRTEVTNAMYARFVEETGYQTYAEILIAGKSIRQPSGSWKHPKGKNSDLTGLEQHPVVWVNWQDAAAYCQWAGRRLPGEAEWEKAARGTDGRTYPWGEDFHAENLNLCGNTCGTLNTVPVGSYPSGNSPYGVMDMAGNVEEWTADFASYYEGRLGRSSSSIGFMREFRVVKGGFWHDSVDTFAIYQRKFQSAKDMNDKTGFRCATSEKYPDQVSIPTVTPFPTATPIPGCVQDSSITTTPQDIPWNLLMWDNETGELTSYSLQDGQKKVLQSKDIGIISVSPDGEYFLARWCTSYTGFKCTGAEFLELYSKDGTLVWQMKKPANLGGFEGWVGSQHVKFHVPNEMNPTPEPGSRFVDILFQEKFVYLDILTQEISAGPYPVPEIPVSFTEIDWCRYGWSHESPDMKYMVFCDDVPSEGFNVVLYDWENQKRIASFPSNYTFPEPVWSPDSTRFLLTFHPRNVFGDSILVMVDLNGQVQTVTEPSQLTPPGERVFIDSWSPDGKFIAYSYSSEIKDESYFVIQNMQDQTVYQTCLSGYQPKWSPDSRYIMMNGSLPGEEDYLYIIDIQQHTMVQLDANKYGHGSFIAP